MLKLCVDLPEALHMDVVNLVKSGQFANKTEVLRFAVRDLLEKYKGC